MYAELTIGIQIEPLIPQFIARGVITQEDKEKLRIQNRQENTGYILDEKILRPLSVDVKGPFVEFLLIIEKSEDPATNCLASKLKKKSDIVLSPPAKAATTVLGMLYYYYAVCDNYSFLF